MADIVYNYLGGVYLNLTSKCPCRCSFCIRKNGDGLGDSEMLWHKKDPTVEEIKEAIDKFDFTQKSEVVVCGYGEPTCSMENLTFACKYLKEKYNIKIRLNTNGLGDLINKRSVAKEVCDVVDVVSVSLNAPNSDSFDKITGNCFPGKAFDAVLKFATDCKKYTDNVIFTVVDVISKEDIEKCRKLSESMGIAFRVREYTA